MRSVCLAIVLVQALSGIASAAPTDGKGIEFFEAKIRPVLIAQCYDCHSTGKKAKGNLLVDTRESLLKGGDNGPALVPGKPGESLLMKALRHEGDVQMPPKGKLSDAVIADFSAWIAMGATDPRDGSVAPKGVDWQEAQRFWSFQPVRQSIPPVVKDTSWPRTPIDRFVLAKLETNGLRPNASADRRTLLRRATYDLTGLPPTPDEIEAFVNDQSSDAYAAAIDRLLASPAYGEMQARRWLDIARYAEDQAHTFGTKPNSNAYRFRDWVVDAFNSDMPYDRFVKFQIAADLLDDGSLEMGKNKAALGFFGLGAQYYKNSDAAKAAADELDDRVDTLTRGFLGLTVSCARCHDHKYDPIPTQDYYSIAGIFWSCKLAEVSIASKEEVSRYQEAQKKVQAADKKVKDLVQAEKDKIIAAKAEELPVYVVAAWKLEAQRLTKPEMSAAVLARQDKIDANSLERMAKFLNRKSQGIPALEAWQKSLQKAGGQVEPPADVLKAAREFADAVKNKLGKGAENMKGDMMQSLFGDKGIFPITEPEVVGKMSPACKQQFESFKTAHAEIVKQSPPAPPAAHGIAEATPVDLKVYIRGNPAKQGDVAPRRFLRIVAGAEPVAFKKGSGRLELAEAIADPKNPLTPRVMVNRLWQQHFGRGIVGTPSNFGKLGEPPTHPELLDYLAARLIETGWSIKQIHREIMLSATYQSSSDSNPKAYAIDPENRLLWRMSRRRLQVEEFRDGMLAVSGRLDRSRGGPTTDLDNPENSRRTLYAKISRHELSGFLRLFDFPDANITSDRRSETTVPQQQLFVLNSAFIVNQAKATAKRLQTEAPSDVERIRRAYTLAFGRPANDDELAIGLNYLNAQDSQDDAGRSKLTRLERYVQALLASNEFIYID